MPVGGIIHRYDDTAYGKSLGTTSHHPLDMLALKWQDHLYETTLTDIEWSTSKTGLINPVAIFDPVDLDGAVTTRATLHNVEGLSEATIEKFMDLGWLKDQSDIYTLSKYKKEMMRLDGFGKKSAEKLLTAIEKSKTTTLERYLYGLSVPLIGRTASKTISKHFKGDYAKFVEALEDGFDFSQLKDFGSTINKSIYNWYEKYSNTEDAYIPILLDFDIPKVKSSDDNKVDLTGKVFVITGSLLSTHTRLMQ